MGKVEVQGEVSGKNVICNVFAFCSRSGWELLGRGGLLLFVLVLLPA